MNACLNKCILSIYTYISVIIKYITLFFPHCSFQVPPDSIERHAGLLFFDRISKSNLVSVNGRKTSYVWNIGSNIEKDLQQGHFFIWKTIKISVFVIFYCYLICVRNEKYALGLFRKSVE